MVGGIAPVKKSDGGLMFGKFPAIIRKYDPNTRECIVSVPTGGEVDAEIQYPIGDRSANTEIEILEGDKVWCEFIQGDTRRALITGYRNPRIGNSSGTRRYHHANIELVADNSLKLIVGGTELLVTSSDVTVNGISSTKHKHMVIKEGQPTDVPQ